MHFEVYCDESLPDLFCAERQRFKYMLIGSLWLPSELRLPIKREIHALRRAHNTWGEIKWHKVSRSKLEFYKGLVDLFFSYGDNVRFRCIAVDSKQFDSRWHDNDDELGFYKCYYQLLHHWIADFNSYRIFCDVKTARDPRRLSKLAEVLGNSNLSSKISPIQALPSGEMAAIQLCDLLVGAASARLNATLMKGSARSRLLEHLEAGLGHEVAPTVHGEKKFNVFRIRLSGGW